MSDLLYCSGFKPNLDFIYISANINNIKKTIPIYKKAFSISTTPTTILKINVNKKFEKYFITSNTEDIFTLILLVVKFF